MSNSSESQNFITIPLKRFINQTNAGEVIDKNYWGAGDEVLYTCALNPMPSNYDNFPEWKRTKTQDLLLTRNGTPYVHKPKVNSIYSNVVQRISLNNEIDRDFAVYAIQDSANKMHGYGVSIQSLNYQMWKEIPVFFPPLDVQKSIVLGLNNELTAIDNLIGKQQELIDGLNQRTLSIICEASTIGTRKSMSLKDANIPWLKKIPSEWNVSPLYAIAHENQLSNKGMLEENLLSLSYGQIVKKDINSNDGLLPESFETYQVVEPNYVIFRLTDLQNDKRSLRSAIVRERGIITSAYLAIIPDKILPEYFNYLMRAYDLMKVFYSMGGGLRQSMKFSDLKRLPIIIPPDGEQKDIVKYLNHELEEQDKLIKKANQSIDLLKERRLSLISASVSGKIDVRIA